MGNRETIDAALLDRIRKLHAKASSAEAIGSTAEAEAFARKVAELLAEHRLTETVLAADDAGDDDTFDNAWFQYSDAKTRVVWRSTLVRAVMTANFLSGYVSTRRIPNLGERSVYRLFGNPADIERAKYLYHVLADLCETAARHFRGNRAAKGAFRLGWAQAVQSRLIEGQKTVRQSSAHALAVFNRTDAAVRSYRDQVLAGEGIRLQRLSGPRIADTAAYHAGAAAGKAATWSEGVRGTAARAAVRAGARLLGSGS